MELPHSSQLPLLGRTLKASQALRLGLLHMVLPGAALVQRDVDDDQGQFRGLTEGGGLSEQRRTFLGAVGVHLFWWMLLAELAPPLPQSLRSEDEEVGQPGEGLPALWIPAESTDGVGESGFDIG